MWLPAPFRNSPFFLTLNDVTTLLNFSIYLSWIQRVETPSNNPWPAICPDRCQNSNDQQYSVAAHRCTVSIFQNIMGAVAITTSSSILSYLQALFGWIWSLISSKHIWLQAIQILNIIFPIYNVVTSGPLLKFQQIQELNFRNQNKTINAATITNSHLANKGERIFFLFLNFWQNSLNW